jgi:hypothetical protein
MRSLESVNPTYLHDISAVGDAQGLAADDRIQQSPPVRSSLFARTRTACAGLRPGASSQASGSGESMPTPGPSAPDLKRKNRCALNIFTGIGGVARPDPHPGFRNWRVRSSSSSRLSVGISLHPQRRVITSRFCRFDSVSIKKPFLLTLSENILGLSENNLIICVAT